MDRHFVTFYSPAPCLPPPADPMGAQIMTDTREQARELLEPVVQELLAKLEEIDGNKPGAFTLRSSGILGSRFQQKRDAILEAIASLATVSPLPVQSEVTEAMIEAASEAIYDFLDERFPDGAMPGGKQLFADDHLDAEFKHETGCYELAKVALDAALAGEK